MKPYCSLIKRLNSESLKIKQKQHQSHSQDTLLENGNLGVCSLVMPVNGLKLSGVPGLLLAERNLSKGRSPQTFKTPLIICLDEVVVIFREYFSTGTGFSS